MSRNSFDNYQKDIQFVVWISWQSHARTRNIAAYLGVQLEEIVAHRKGIARYLSLSLRTVSFLVSRTPKVLIVQNPSMILTGLALFLRPILRFRLVVDAHNEAVEPYLHKEKVVLWLSRLYLKSADLTLVTNEPLKQIVHKARGRAFVLPDKVPEYMGSISSDSASGKLSIVLISTFAKDEPIEEFLEAASYFEDYIIVHVTGCAEKLNVEVRERTRSNVHFTGFLNEEDYWELLASADAIADLTRMDNCLVCGAYEGIAVGKPMILSDNEATRAHFNKGVIYVDNNVSEIKIALGKLQEKKVELQQQSIKLRQELRVSWADGAERLVEVLRELE